MRPTNTYAGPWVGLLEGAFARYCEKYRGVIGELTLCAHGDLARAKETSASVRHARMSLPEGELTSFRRLESS